MDSDSSGVVARDGFIALEARDAVRNIARKYLVEISTDLFGAVIVESSWGRIGCRGRSKRLSFTTRARASRYVGSVLRQRAGAIIRIGTAYRVVEQSYEVGIALDMHQVPTNQPVSDQPFI